MKRTIIWSIAALLLVLGVGLIARAYVQRVYSPAASGVWDSDAYTEIRSLDVFADRIDAIAEDHRWQVDAIGTLSDGGLSAPLFTIRTTNFDSPAGLLVIAGVHGNEPAGVEAALRFIEGSAGIQLPAEYRVDVVPLVNPWGWSHGCRFAENGQDINRDASTSRTSASRMVHTLRSGGYRCVLDLHESSVLGGAYIYTYLRGDRAFASTVLDQIAASGIVLGSGRLDIFNVTDGMVRVPRILTWLLMASGRSSLAHRFSSRASTAFTIETSLAATWEQRVATHLIAIRNAVETLRVNE